VRLLVATEARLFRSGDGRIYTDGLYARSFFDRYLTVFDEVRVLARVAGSELAEPPGPGSLVEDARVRVHALPDYRGALGTARHGSEVARLARAAVDGVDAAMLRAPGYVSQAAHRALQGRPYGVEVVGDPAEVFRSGASRHPARAVIRRSTSGTLRRMTEQATVVGYVSSVVLPQRYPAPRARAVATYSSVSLTPESFLVPRAEPRPVRALVTVTSLEQPYKGVDVLLRALTRLPDDVTLTVVGDGRLRVELVGLARALGVGAG
jgi:glycosyltransferase involved in cell wall biosynthesis